MEGGSFTYPVDEYGLAFIERFRWPQNSPVTQDIFSFTCAMETCQTLSYVHERYFDGVRTIYEHGELQAVSEEEFQNDISNAYDSNSVAERDRVLLPLESNCLVAEFYGSNLDSCNLFEQENFCQDRSTFPHCPRSKSPYQEPDGEVRPGVIVAFVLASIVFILGIAFIVWVLLNRAQSKRSREFFALRMMETMETTDKSVLEFTPEEMLKEFKLLEEKTKGVITKDTMYDFLSGGPRGYMDYWDFLVLWKEMNMKMNSTLDFLEFCSFMAHSHEDLEEAKSVLGRNEEEKKGEQSALVEDADVSAI